jgi:uncharacterized membrane protein
MTAIGAVFGGIGGAASIKGFHIIIRLLLSPLFWVPIIVAGSLFFFGRRVTKKEKISTTEKTKLD